MRITRAIDNTFGRFHSPFDRIHPRAAGAASSDARKGSGDRDTLFTPLRGDFALDLEVDRTRFMAGISSGWETLPNPAKISQHLSESLNLTVRNEGACISNSPQW